MSEQQTQKKTALKVIEGGKAQKGGKEPPSGTTNWLYELPRGTVFLAQSTRDDTSYCHQYLVIGHYADVTKLSTPHDWRKYSTAEPVMEEHWFETAKFSRNYRLVQILGIPSE